MFNFQVDTPSFIKSKNIGKKGESAVIEYYISKGKNVIDVSEQREFQKIDVDLIIDDEFIEVKTQSSINKNQKLTLELEINKNDDVYCLGWFYQTEANILIFYDKFTNTAYSIRTAELRELFNKHSNEFDIYYFDEEYKVSKLAFVNIDFLKNNAKSFEIINYNTTTA